VFATILAMITEEVNSILLAARSGRAPINMSGHILLLNWNAQVRGAPRGPAPAATAIKHVMTTQQGQARSRRHA
jgi:hypothetical protein